MFLYYFNKGDMKVLHPKHIRVSCNATHLRGDLDLEEDPRKDRYKRWIEFAAHEGEVYFNTIWLKEQDDEKAKELYSKYLANKIEKETARLQKLKKIEL